MAKFIDSNNHLVFMDMQVKYEEPDIRLPEEDIQKLSNAGIKTAMMFHIDWNEIEKTQGKRDFSYFDRRIELLQKCGMRVMIQCFTFLPKWVPDEWKVKTASGAIMDMISPWNEVAMDYALSLYDEMFYRYTSKDVMVINGWLTDGETLFPNEPCIYDESAKGAFNALYGHDPRTIDFQEESQFLHDKQIETVMKISNILRNNEYGDVWLALHPALAGYRGNGCEYIEDILNNIQNRFPCTNINQLYCTWTQWSGLFPQMNYWKNKYSTRVFGGAEYAQGVVSSTYLAIAQNIDGLLINPCHPHTGYSRVEPWMIKNIEKAVEIWQARLPTI